MTATMLNRNQTFASPSEALAHFGVKGMKWGVNKQKDPYVHSTESKQLRKESRDIAQEEFMSRIRDQPLFESMTRQEFSNLSTEGREFAAGLDLSRISSRDEASLKGAAYVSRLQEDAAFYLSLIHI